MDQSFVPPYEVSSAPPAGERGKKRTFVVAALVVGIILGICATYLARPLLQRVASFTAPRQEQANTALYQAVFLTNGQVYFGSVEDDTADPVVVRDIYYLQVTQQLQPDPNAGGEPQQTPQISLVKLGNELHGPTDEMRITRSHVLFVENLKDDSDVVKAIQAAAEAE